ncbi:hypothetical protein [Nocardiopsis lucentensis]|uniref:hypothetical protein n=1 Tax=Nocardiopsis lucentensis TaxID=53441 RepID=UPI00034DF979|nr:hypothetical protein [Nocardiopsis lucentensis]
MSFTFSQPSGGGFFKPAEHDGHLVLITNCHKIEDRYDQFKARDVPAATVDVVDLDGEQQLREGVLMTHGGLVNRLSPGAHMVLGRIGKATTSSGFEAWVLAPFDEQGDDARRAQEWLDAQGPSRTSAAPGPASGPASPAPEPAQQRPSSAATGAPAMADPNDPAVQALLASLQQK